MSDNQELSIACSERKSKNVSRNLKLSECSDESLYDVIVHTYEDRNRHKECTLGNHSIYLLIQDVSENYASNMESSVYYQCACLKCGRLDDFKMSIRNRRKVVNTHLDSITSLLSFYNVRKKYLELKGEQLSDEEISLELNTFYDSLQEEMTSKNKKLEL